MSPVRSIDVVAVLGAGTMGHGIAQVCAGVGCEVALEKASDSLVVVGVPRL